ncbi:hypothetical protein ACJRO7_004343 [Eucalyptus globulus]|uniref:Retrotransposon gag domain-containing protein n=1 Tax=Eucalyptus globulus TaxID=34317 RepID=A0ABD3J165_EUCGL
MRELMGQQAWDQAAAFTPAIAVAAQAAAATAFATAAKAATVAAPTTAPVAMPAGVQPKNIEARRERLIHKLVEHFLKLSPPRFTSTGDPKATSLWIQDLEKAFALLMCTLAEKVTLVVYELQGNANIWWRATKDTIFPEGVIPVWDAFLKAFNDQYFSGMA